MQPNKLSGPAFGLPGSASFLGRLPARLAPCHRRVPPIRGGFALAGFAPTRRSERVVGCGVVCPPSRRRRIRRLGGGIKDTLSLVFFLAAALTHLRFERSRALGAYAVASGFFVLACSGKRLGESGSATMASASVTKARRSSVRRLARSRKGRLRTPVKTRVGIPSLGPIGGYVLALQATVSRSSSAS